MPAEERDHSFITLSSVILKRLRRAIDHGDGLNINVEFGYGGARAMDVRWTSPASFDVWRAILLELRGTSSMVSYPRINLVGSSVGNLVLFSLSVLLPIAWRCCITSCRQNGGTGRDRRLTIDLHTFRSETGLNLFPESTCVCDALRRLLDVFLEENAADDHPLMRKTKTRNRSRFKTFLSTETTLHQLLGNHPHSASAYTRLYTEDRLRYMVVMFRAIVKLESKLCSFYILARRILLSVATRPFMSSEPLAHRCAFFVASQSLAVSEFRIDRWLDTGTPNTLIPLVSLLDRKKGRHEQSHELSQDAERFNRAMDLLLGSVDVRDMVMPVVSTVIMGVTPKRLLIKPGNESSASERDYFPTHRRPGQLCLVAYRERHVLDIMSPNVRSLPEFDSYIRSLQKQEEMKTQLDIIPGYCSNYVLELSPNSRHLFPSHRIAALVSGCSPPLPRDASASAHPKKRQQKLTRRQLHQRFRPFVNI
uniref:Wsv206-like protein n=1 Tax=Melicertus latisulcatus pemonivirus TaxID=2984278 RepID=A0A9C7BMQ3_9VIRU|nr:MAG: wsv206-like protein [Melicertus latisulcatus pemonivirus]